MQVGDVDYITRAPRGKEVEDLEKEEVLVALRDKAPTEQVINNLDFNLDTQVKGHKNKINRPSKGSDRRAKNLNKSDKFHGNKNGRTDRKDKFDRKDRTDRKNGRNDRRGKDRNSRGRRDRQGDRIQDSRIKLLKNMLKDLEGTGNSEIYDDSLNLIKETNVETLYEDLKQDNPDADTVIFDGVISQRLVDIAYSKGIKTLVAFKSSRVIKRPDKLRLVTLA